MCNPNVGATSERVSRFTCRVFTPKEKRKKEKEIFDNLIIIDEEFYENNVTQCQKILHLIFFFIVKIRKLGLGGRER